MNPTHLMIIGFGSILILFGALAPQGGWNIYVIGLGLIHVIVGNVLVFLQLKRTWQEHAATTTTEPAEKPDQES